MNTAKFMKLKQRWSLQSDTVKHQLGMENKVKIPPFPQCFPVFVFISFVIPLWKMQSYVLVCFSHQAIKIFMHLKVGRGYFMCLCCVSRYVFFRMFGSTCFTHIWVQDQVKHTGEKVLNWILIPQQSTALFSAILESHNKLERLFYIFRNS